MSSKDMKYHKDYHLNNTKYNTRDDIKLPSVIKKKSLCKNLSVLPVSIQNVFGDNICSCGE
jgi:hypothetical protein